MITTVKRVQLPDNRRILMVSDIHGHTEGLRALLAQADFSAQDILIIVGDLVEKGPDSLGTLRQIMELCRDYTVYPLLGNVDLWRLERLLSDETAMQQHLLRYSIKAQRWWNVSFLGELCAEIGVPLTADMDTQTVFPQLRRHFAEELAFLSGLPTVLETQNMIFVHGGIPHENLDALAGQDCQPLLKRDHFLSDGLSFHKYVVVGHWPVALYSQSYPCANPIIDRERRIICLDGGCGLKDDGQLNLLCLADWQSEDFTLCAWNSLPTITALDAQEASAASGYIRWGDHEVTLLAQNGDMARVLHHDREMDVPASFLYEQDGKTLCNDITNYRLPVSPGDVLSLVLTMPHGCYVKKAGVTGWYMGRYQINT